MPQPYERESSSTTTPGMHIDLPPFSLTRSIAHVTGPVQLPPNLLPYHQHACLPIVTCGCLPARPPARLPACLHGASAVASLPSSGAYMHALMPVYVLDHGSALLLSGAQSTATGQFHALTGS